LANDFIKPSKSLGYVKYMVETESGEIRASGSGPNSVLPAGRGNFPAQLLQGTHFSTGIYSFATKCGIMDNVITDESNQPTYTATYTDGGGDFGSGGFTRDGIAVYGSTHHLQSNTVNDCQPEYNNGTLLPTGVFVETYSAGGTLSLLQSQRNAVIAQGSLFDDNTCQGFCLGVNWQSSPLYKRGLFNWQLFTHQPESFAYSAGDTITVTWNLTWS
jgi:hypothetical protein